MGRRPPKSTLSSVIQWMASAPWVEKTSISGTAGSESAVLLETTVCKRRESGAGREVP